MRSSSASADIACGRLTIAELGRNFADAHPPLTAAQAQLEAERCYYCHDAPCTAACPTGIDVPSFIARIAQDNLRGAARAILEANILGGMCARVCPTEVLCEDACVRHTQEDKPVEIGRLQRHATDAFLADPQPPLFTRAAASGKTVAVVGAGPAGLACAHRLARSGHAVALYDAKPKLGGLNEYGLAAYKTVDGFAQREIEWLLSIGGIEVRCGQRLGTELRLRALIDGHDAVFLGLGLAGVNGLGLDAKAEAHVRPAVDFIAELRQAQSPATVAVGRRVVVIGGGMTAVDAAVQSRLLGADEATIVYRRGPEAMSASAAEQDWARRNGVQIRHWAAPRALLADGDRLCGIRFARTRIDAGRLIETGDTFEVAADVVLGAIGQRFVADPLDGLVELQDGRIRTDAQGRSSHPKVWAGGDCRSDGLDLTVQAVEHGKVAAIAIDRALRS